MNCSTLRRNLLAADHPAAPSAVEAGHIASCAACRAWHGRLVHLEKRLPTLLVPACPVPSSLLGQIRSPTVRLASHPRDPQMGRQKLALAFSLAASLAVFSVGWWAWPRIQSDDHPATVVAESYQSRRDHELAHAKTPVERAGALTDLADDFLAEARRQANDPARLAVLAAHFDRLVREDLMDHVRRVSPGERGPLVTTLTRRLGSIESEASRLAADWQVRHASSAAALRRIAVSAREADRRLRAIV